MIALRELNLPLLLATQLLLLRQLNRKLAIRKWFLAGRSPAKTARDNVYAVPTIRGLREQALVSIGKYVVVIQLKQPVGNCLVLLGDELGHQEVVEAYHVVQDV